MPLCTTYNPSNAHASPVRTKTESKGRRAAVSTNDNDTVVAKTMTENTVTEKITTEKTVKTKTGAVLDAINAIKEIGAISVGSAPTSKGAAATSDEENQNGTAKRRGSVLSSGGGPLVSVTNTSSVGSGEEKAKEKVDELSEQKNSKDLEDVINEGEGGEGQWRDKEGLAFEHARQRAKKASERAKRRAKKAEMQAVAMAFVAPVVEREVKEKQGVEGMKDAKNGEGGNGLHKGSRVGRVGMRKADAGNFKVDVKGMVDLDMSGVDSYFKNAHERVRSMSGELNGVDFGLEGIGREDEEGRREVSLSELVYFAAQKKSRKNKGHDFEMIPALKTVIVLDDVDADMEVDEAWDHIDDLSMDGEVELSYAKVVAGGGR